MTDHYFWEQLTKNFHLRLPCFLAKVLISKINDANQTIIGLNSSFRPKGLFKTMRFVKRGLLTVKLKCQICAKLCGEIPDKGIISNKLWCDTFIAHTNLRSHSRQDKHQTCLVCSFYLHKDNLIKCWYQDFKQVPSS